ncbi:hypothetical protein M422DRAFT_269450 [Sphaerobolus stellatus SS14]|uniref:DUF6534 domain-containing protein n=1 Tax=Sphaerobolus stellatus (strain SS14) TaxID=990650 RepID=A0A0C9TI39_SPHS4|nr:hypothetical protein M422DRAFT_269450 [Sphaerobolus stellatus SS14]
MQTYITQLGPSFWAEVCISLLQGMMLLQYQVYWTHNMEENRWRKWLVHMAVGLSSIKFVYNTFVNYDRTVYRSFWRLGILCKLGTFKYTAVAVLSTTLSAAPCQIYYIYRCWILSHNRVFLIVASLGLIISVGGSCIVTWGAAEALLGIQHGTYIVNPGANVNLAAGLACDVVITVFTCYYLLTHKSGFSRKTDTLVHRLILISIETALGPTILALVNLILRGRAESSQWYILPNGTLGHVYAISLLYTVNARRTVKNGLTKVISSFNINQSTRTTELGRDSQVYGSIGSAQKPEDISLSVLAITNRPQSREVITT